MKLRWTAAARHDRANIRDYIAEDDPRAAIRMDELFEGAATRLRDFPHLGRPGRIAGTRELLPHRSYRLVYRIVDDTVLVLGIIHTSRQWPPSPM